MKKMFLVVLAFTLSCFALAGCRASGEVDPHGATSIVAPR
jgi:hypothetical protein